MPEQTFGDKLRGDELGSAVGRYYPVGAWVARYFSLSCIVVLFPFAGSVRYSLKIGRSRDRSRLEPRSRSHTRILPPTDLNWLIK